MTNSKIRKRCVNLDWLEVYVLESRHCFPCNADYFRQQGYFVNEREYGTRSYKEMFTIEDDKGQPWIEVRRNPMSGDSEFTGLVPESCHLRLVNRACYDDNAVEKLRQFMMKHDYNFQRIYRIDVCYDFEYFDWGDNPTTFAKRYLRGVYRKINQTKLYAIGNDNWADFDWETLSWGNPKSMVSTKLYDKTKELSTPKKDKPYIRYSWWLCGLVDSPVDCCKVNEKGERYKPRIWRVEFSMKAQARKWLKIENVHGKKPKTEQLPHTLSMFDAKDKLWQRFQDLAYHYFCFKVAKYKSSGRMLVSPALESIRANESSELQRKDRCPNKLLFRFDKGKEFYSLQQLPKASKPDNDEIILKRRLQRYKMFHLSPKITEACDTILNDLERTEVRRLCEEPDPVLIAWLQEAIAYKTRHPEMDVTEIFKLLKNHDGKEAEIWK